MRPSRRSARPAWSEFAGTAASSPCCRVPVPNGSSTKPGRSALRRWTSFPSRSRTSSLRPWRRRTDMLQMLWYKAWLDTRWRFLITAGMLMCSAGAVVLTYPRVMALMPLVPPQGTGGEIAQRIREAAERWRNYRGYIWSQWLRQNALQLGTLTAALLGTGGVAPSGSRGALFLLSLPVSRTRLLGIRAAAGLAEWLAAALASCLL